MENSEPCVYCGTADSFFGEKDCPVHGERAATVFCDCGEVWSKEAVSECPRCKSKREADAIQLKAIADARKDLEQERDTLQRNNAELSAQVERLRAALNWFIEKTSMEGSIDGKPYCRWCYSKSDHAVDCLIGQALSLTPSNALKERLKP